MNNRLALLTCAVGSLGAGTLATGALNNNQVLVVYNSQDAASTAVYNHYASVHSGVLGIDLNTTFTSSNTIPYSEYISKIRDPIRNYLNTPALQQQVTVMTLTKGIPHRIDDTDNAGVGDNPLQAKTEVTNGDTTYATVDSELTLLWRNLSAGEAGGMMDSFADNFVFNPYHGQSQSISNFSRSNITNSKTFINNGNVVWEMREGSGGVNPTDGGDLYLTTRLDGNSAAQVITSINKAQQLIYNRAGSKIIIDENDANLNGLGWELDDNALTDPQGDDPSYQGPDYEDTFSLISPTWSNVTFNQNAQFLTGVSAPGSGSFNDANRVQIAGMIAALITQGGNHSTANQSGYLDTFAGQLANGAILNAIESYGGKNFGGAGGFDDQGQLSKWIELGGTFGVGNAWEPFAFSLSDNELLLENFLNNRLTWAEAAWSSIPYLSWQQLVIGDPLARVTQVGDTDFDGDIDLSDLANLAASYGQGSGQFWPDGDFDFDGDVDLNDLSNLAANYGLGEAQAIADFLAITSVPEPAGAGLLAGAVATLLQRRRSRLPGNF
jgi:hypothetical protein